MKTGRNTYISHPGFFTREPERTKTNIASVTLAPRVKNRGAKEYPKINRQEANPVTNNKKTTPANSPAPQSALGKLVRILELERLEENLFRGHSPDEGWQRVFGGQVVGQALRAATQTVEGRHAHSLHAYFMRPGDPSVPIIYEVERTRNGRSFSTRRVIAIQHGKVIFTMGCSFHMEEPGFAHQIQRPDVPDPDELPGEGELLDRYMELMPQQMRAYWQGERAIELRPVDFGRYLSSEKAAPLQQVWMRPTGPLPDDLAVHQCAIAFATDLALLDTALVPHGRSIFDPRLKMASIDHALWLHKPARFDDWLLYSTDSPITSGARGFTRGTLFTRKGELVASSTQEGLLREVEKKR